MNFQGMKLLSTSWSNCHPQNFHPQNSVTKHLASIYVLESKIDVNSYAWHLQAMMVSFDLTSCSH